MFPYDSQLAALVATAPNTIPEVIGTMQQIDAVTVNGDGLKWFNWLYLQVTSAVETRVASGGFTDPDWLAELDVQFAWLYFSALTGYLNSGACPDSWGVLFDRRNHTQLARLQFAMAGINAHINHDLALAVVTTCRMRATVPLHSTVQYQDFTALNSTLDSLIEQTKKELHVRLLGDALPPVSLLEDMLAAWGTAAAREKAWTDSEVLWHLDAVPVLANAFMDGIDGATAFAGKALLSPVP